MIALAIVMGVGYLVGGWVGAGAALLLLMLLAIMVDVM